MQPINEEICKVALRHEVPVVVSSQLDRRHHRDAAIMTDLHAGGDQLGGPKPFAATDRSRFLQALDTAVVAVKRG